ncbi:UDP-N-acetylmuramate--L-alanine ligase [Streptomyces mirabilis]|uniref:UDP-N-acetylmuramate--L-alanine ligase n=1 Tax=Streptomyces mirabilis TaxID=68239 RepID=UPI00367F5E2A
MAETAVPKIVPSVSAGEPIDLTRPHFVGIAGTGMLPVARVCSERGFAVSGSDTRASERMEELTRLGVTVYTGHAAEQVPADATAVVFTHAIESGNPEILAALERGVPVVHRAAALDALMAGHMAVGVLGTHGKSSTSGMLAVTLSRMGQSPSYMVGADIEGPGSGGRAGSSGLFVAEIDESDRTLLGVGVNVAVVTNIGYDHPENYADAAGYVDVFEAFVRGMRAGGAVVLNADSSGCRELQSRLSAGDGPRVVTFGESTEADWRLTEMACTGRRSTALLCGPQGQEFHLTLRIPGVHQLLNAAGAMAALAVLGQDLDLAVEELGYFDGVQRRMSSAGMMAGVRIYDSYAHHPTEITADLKAARALLPGQGRVITVFRPTGQARLDAFGSEFATALASSDAVVLTGDARSISEASLREVSVSIGQAGGAVLAVETARERAVMCASTAAREGDVVVLMGTGDLNECGVLLRRALSDLIPTVV